MTTRSSRLSNDLSADLLAEQRSDAPAPVPTNVVRAPTRPQRPTAQESRGPFLETTWLLSPRAWLSPRAHLSGATVVLGLGPLQVRGGRR